MTALADRNLHYQAVVTNDLMDAQAPAAADFSLFVRMQDRDVILVRTNGPNFAVSNPHKGLYAAFVTVPTVLGPIPVPRGWCSVDVEVNDLKFTFFDTHLETLFPPPFDTSALQLAQAGELIGIMNAATGPVLIG